MPQAQLVPPQWELPNAIRNRLGEEVGRQRAMIHQGHLLLVLHAVPEPDESSRQGRFFWRSPEGAWSPKALRHGGSPVGELIQEYNQRLDQLDADEDTACSAKEYFGVLTYLNPLLRSLRNLHAALQHARESLPEVRELIVLRDRAYSVLRRAELLQADARNTLEFIIAQQSERHAAASQRQATSAHRLNVLAALTFPLLTLCALFGVNLRHGFEQYDAVAAPWPLLVVTGIGVGLGVAVLGYVTRR